MSSDRVGHDPIPGAINGPFPQPFVVRLPRPVALKQVSPRGLGTWIPQNPIEELTVVPLLSAAA
jgi:hypothetical protein